MKHWLFLVIAIIGEVIATSALKASDGFSKVLPATVVVVGYAVAFYFFALALKAIPVGIAYAVWAGIGIVCVTAISRVIYGQRLDFAACVGLFLIIAGVAVINLFSHINAR